VDELNRSQAESIWFLVEIVILLRGVGQAQPNTDPSFLFRFLEEKVVLC
jgi:hypothetical protein